MREKGRGKKEGKGKEEKGKEEKECTRWLRTMIIPFCIFFHHDRQQVTGVCRGTSRPCTRSDPDLLAYELGSHGDIMHIISSYSYSID